MFGSCVGGNSHMYTQTSKYNVGHITTHTIFSTSITVQTLAHSHINPHTHTTLQAISPYSVLVSVLCVGYTCCHGNNNTLTCRPLTHYIQCQNQSMYGAMGLVAMATATVQCRPLKHSQCQYIGPRLIKISFFHIESLTVWLLC